MVRFVALGICLLLVAMEHLRYVAAVSDSRAFEVKSMLPDSTPNADGEFRQLWLQRRRELQTRCVYRNKKGKLKTWLRALGENGESKLRVGCLVCAKCKLPGRMGAFDVTTAEGIRIPKLRRHAETIWHKTALQSLCAPEAASSLQAPSRQEFATLYGQLRNRRHGEIMENSLVHRKKSRAIIWCLAEAIRNRQREAFRRSQCMALSQDGSETRHLARFVSCDDNLTVTSGILGMVRCHGAGHKAVLEATKQIYVQAATPGCGASKVAVPHDDALYNHMRMSTILWNTDAGPDELLAGTEAKSWQASANDIRPFLPELAYIHRDKAHASRRVIRRPWFADAVLLSVHKEFVAMMSLIQHSHVLKAWYVEFQAVAAQHGETDLTIQPSLSYCAVRFDSLAKPLAVAVLTIDAVILTAIKNVTTRKGNSSCAPTTQFLNFISGEQGVKHLLLAAMLADAACECLQLTRELDTEDQGHPNFSVVIWWLCPWFRCLYPLNLVRWLCPMDSRGCARRLKGVMSFSERNSMESI